jgi:hypothetical protein
MMIPADLVVPADITNCRLVMITPPAHADPVIGQRTNACEYVPPRRFGGPNGAIPQRPGRDAPSCRGTRS